MRILDLNATQCQVAERLRALHVDRIKELLGLQRWKKKEMAWPLERLLAFFLIFQTSRTPCFKAFWAMRSQAAFEAGEPPWPSYNTFHKWFSRSGPLLQELAAQTLGPLRQSVGYIDSMKLPICESYRWVKSMRGHAGRGHSACGEYYGLKLHALIDNRGNLCAACATPANVHDLAPVKDAFLRGCTGTVYGDKGYISRDVHYELMKQNLLFLARPRENMGFETQWSFEYVRNWRFRHAKPYRRRQSIERFFNELKGDYNLTLMGLRSPKMAQARIYSAILCRQWMRLGFLTPSRIV